MQTVIASENHGIDLKKTRKEFKKCLDEVYRHFYLDDNCSADVVHELRVNVKRIDALISLLRSDGIQLSCKKLKAFRTLFNMAGRLRTRQIEFDTVSKYFTSDSVNPNYLHQIHEEKSKRLKKYVAFIGKGPSKKLTRGIEILKKEIKNLRSNQILRYEHAEEKRLLKRLKRQIFREQELHMIRKDLKRYYLTLKMSGQPNDFTEKLQELLGRWHDHQIAFDHVIRAIYTSNCTPAENEPVKKMKYSLINDKERLYEEIVSFYVSNIHYRDT
jgi:CHAD domain-containing protein